MSRHLTGALTLLTLLCATQTQAVTNDYLPEVRLSSGDINVNYSANGLDPLLVQGIPIWLWSNNVPQMPTGGGGDAPNIAGDLSKNCSSQTTPIASCSTPSQLGNAFPNYSTTYPFVIAASNQEAGPHFSGANSNNLLYPSLTDPRIPQLTGGTNDGYDHMQLYNVTSTTASDAEANGDYFTYTITTGNYSPDYELLFSGATFKQGGENNKQFIKYSRQIIIYENGDINTAKILTQDSDTQKTPTNTEFGPVFLNAPNPIVAKPNTTYTIRIYVYNPIHRATTPTSIPGDPTSYPDSMYLDDFGLLYTVKTVPDVVSYTEGTLPVKVDVATYPATVIDNPATITSIAPSKIASLYAALGLTESDLTLTADPITPKSSDVTTLKIQAKNILDGGNEVLIIGGVSFPLATSKTDGNVSYDASTKTFTITGGSASSYQSLIQGIQYQNTSNDPTVTTSADAVTHPRNAQTSTSAPNSTQRIFNFTVIDSASNISNIAPAYVNVYPVSLPIKKAVNYAYITVTDTPSSTLTSNSLKASELNHPLVTYTLTMTNNNTSTVSGIVATDLLPTGMRYGGTATLNGASIAPTESTDISTGRDYLKFNVGTLAAGATATITFTATTTQSSTPTLTTLNSNVNQDAYKNEAKVYVNISDLTTIATTTIPEDTSNAVTTDVIYTKLFKQVNNLTHPTNPVWGNLNQAYPGDTLKYCIDFYNYSTKGLTNYSITDSLPLNSKYVGGSLTVNQGTMAAPGAPMTATLSQPTDAATSGTLTASNMTVPAKSSGTFCFETKVQ